MIEDWRGEHLIRARPKSDDVDGRPFNRGGSMISRKAPKAEAPPPARQCNAPGCGNKLWSGNTSGFCTEHRPRKY